MALEVIDAKEITIPKMKRRKDTGFEQQIKEKNKGKQRKRELSEFQNAMSSLP